MTAKAEIEQIQTRKALTKYMRTQTVDFAQQWLRNPFFLAALGLAAALNASATSFNAVSDFSLANNPNGSWSYLASSNLLSTAVVGSGSLTGIDYWWSNQSEPNSDVIGKNMTSSTISFESICSAGRLPLDGSGKRIEC